MAAKKAGSIGINIRTKSIELLPEPNVHNDIQKSSSPNTTRLEEKEKEYRTLLNNAVRAFEKTQYRH